MNKLYPFLEYIKEDKSKYKHAKDAGFVDEDDDFLIGDSGGFLLNIRPGWKFVNTDLFTEVGDYYLKHKQYTTYRVDSIPHRQFRRREEYRRKNGFSAPCLMDENGTIHNVRITGAHYNFLNYTMMERLDESTVKNGAKNTAAKIYSFPKFIDAQYWTFKIQEFAKNNGFNLLIDKTRRGGFSYIEASDSANIVNSQSHKVVIHVAADKKYLTQAGGLSDFATNNLKFYEEKSPFVRGVFSSVISDFKLGYKLPSGVEATNSWKSALLSVSAMNNPNCAIGKDAVEVKVEEVSEMDNFDDFMTVTEPALRTGAYTTGFLVAWGTATAGNMQTFEQNFYNPKAHNFMPFENVWDEDCRDEVCGYFKPYCWGLQGEVDGKKGLDKDGNSDIEIGLTISQIEREDKRINAKTYADYINYLGQYANMPCESFSSTTENIFSSEILTAWEERLRVDSDLHFYVDGGFVEEGKEVRFISNNQLAAKGHKVYSWIFGVPRRANEDPHGCVRMWFPPIKVETESGRKETPKGLYSITYDPVGVDKAKNEITNKHSHNSMKVWENPSIYNGYKQRLVCAYYGRPDKLEEADWICYCLARFYNCIGSVNVEVNRGETVSNFKKWHALSYLSYEPIYIWDESLRGKVNTSYGYVIAGDKRLEGIRLLKEFLYEEIGKDENGKPIYNFHRIYDYQSILELKKWNIMGNFDRVSEMLLRGIEWKGMGLKEKKDLERHKHIDKENDNFFNRRWF